MKQWADRGQVSRRGFLRGAFMLGAAGAAVYAVGCGGSDEAPGETTPTPGGMTGMTPSATGAAGTIAPVLLTSEFVAGRDNRFLVGLLDEANELVRDADVYLKFFTVNPDGQSGKLRGEGSAQYVQLDLPGDSNLGETPGYYVVNTPFDVAGMWAVEIAATPTGAENATTIQAPFEVFEQFRVPAIGTVPPASQNDTAATNPNTASLCSRDPACSLHDKVIADYLGKGRPLVVQFSTPAFCETRFCGPVLDVLLEQVPAYEDRIDFIHIEVWQDFQLRQTRAAAQEWQLPMEPITFFMASDGKVAGFLEAIFSPAELTSALDQLAAL